MNTIRSATFRLTLSYLGVIMVLSIAFSALLYQVSSAELARSLRRPLPQGSYMMGQSLYEQLREQQLAEGLIHLQENLVVLNLLTLAAGGLVSFGLARWTLRPIEEAMEVQGRFAADASHELRTPLTAMQTEIEVALRDPKLTSAESKALLRSNLEEIAKLKSLSDGLLKLTQLDRAELMDSPIDLTAAVQEAIDRYAKTADQKSITIDTKLIPVSVKGDHSSLVELTAILIDNAIKYSEPGTTISVSLRQTSKQAELQVRDQGMGIKASDKSHIFERFYRADQSRAKSTVGGYGLGLSIAQHIVRLHSGSIDVKSQVGKGTTFIIKLSHV